VVTCEIEHGNYVEIILVFYSKTDTGDSDYKICHCDSVVNCFIFLYNFGCHCYIFGTLFWVFRNCSVEPDTLYPLSAVVT